MTPLESILQQARHLPIDQQIQLAEMLMSQANGESGSDEQASGQRGLDSWTESTRDEDWSEYCPADLQVRRES